MTPREALIALLESRDDLLPAPETSTGRLQRRNVVGSGPVPCRHVPCPMCSDSDKEVGRMRSGRICTRCGGNLDTGEVGRGYLVIDDYTGQEVGTQDTEVHAMMTDVRCDRCGGWGRVSAYSRHEPPKDAPRCDRCRGRGTVPAPDARRLDSLLQRLASAAAGDPVLTALERREQAGSYHELDAALHSLRELYPGWHRLVLSVHVTNTRKPDDLLDAEQRGLDHGLGFLERNMPDPIRVPPWLDRTGRYRERKEPMWRSRNGSQDGERHGRNEKILTLHAQGLPVWEIAQAVALTERRILQIVASGPVGA